MKSVIFPLFALLFSLNIVAQYDVNINENKIVTAKQKRDSDQLRREELGGCKFVAFQDYSVGMKFYFPNDAFKLKYDSYYKEYYGVTQLKKNKFQENQIRYKNLAGKIFEIVKIEERKTSYSPETYFTLKQIDSAFVIEHKSMFNREFLKQSWEKESSDGQVSVLPDGIYTGEIDSFKERYLNKEFYTLFLVNGKRFKKVRIIEVGAGTENEPIRAVVINELGNKQQIDFCTCGTNVRSQYYHSNTMDNYFVLNNPKEKYKGSNENWELICERKIKVGFEENDLRLSWGRPESINETIVSGKKYQQYVYSDQYVYLENGIVVSFQSSK